MQQLSCIFGYFYTTMVFICSLSLIKIGNIYGSLIVCKNGRSVRYLQTGERASGGRGGDVVALPCRVRAGTVAVITVSVWNTDISRLSPFLSIRPN